MNVADYYYKITSGDRTIEVGFSHHHELMDYMRSLDGPIVTHAGTPNHPPYTEPFEGEEGNGVEEDPMWIVGTYHVNSKNKRVTKYLAQDGDEWCWTTKRTLAQEFTHKKALNFSCPTPIPMEKCHRATVLEA